MAAGNGTPAEHETDQRSRRDVRRAQPARPRLLRAFDDPDAAPRPSRCARGSLQRRLLQRADLAGYGPVVFAGDDLSVGDRVDLGFIAPTLWDPLHVRARIAWVRARADAQEPMRFGVAFDHEDPASVMSLYELVASLDYEG